MEMLTCSQCGKKFESVRKDAKFCKDSCRKKFKRIQADLGSENVRDNVIAETIADKEPVRDNWTEATGRQPEKELPVIQVAADAFPTKQGSDNYYESAEYLALVKHLEETSLADLKKEGIFIPAWKLSGFKRKPTAQEIIAVCGGFDKKNLRD